jgi:hypothetical protein
MSITEDAQCSVLACRLFSHCFKLFTVAFALFCHLSNRHEILAPVTRNELHSDDLAVVINSLRWCSVFDFQKLRILETSLSANICCCIKYWKRSVKLRVSNFLCANYNFSEALYNASCHKLFFSRWALVCPRPFLNCHQLPSYIHNSRQYLKAVSSLGKLETFHTTLTMGHLTRLKFITSTLL